MCLSAACTHQRPSILCGKYDAVSTLRSPPTPNSYHTLQSESTVSPSTSTAAERNFAKSNQTVLGSQLYTCPGLFNATTCPSPVALPVPAVISDRPTMTMLLSSSENPFYSSVMRFGNNTTHSISPL